MKIIREVLLAIEQIKDKPFVVEKKELSFPTISVNTSYDIQLILERVFQLSGLERQGFSFCSVPGQGAIIGPKNFVSQINPKLIEKVEKVTISYLWNLSLNWEKISLEKFHQMENENLPRLLMSDKLKENPESVIFFQKTSFLFSTDDTVIRSCREKHLQHLNVRVIRTNNARYLVGKENEINATIDEIRKETIDLPTTLKQACLEYLYERNRNVGALPPQLRIDARKFFHEKYQEENS